MKQRTFFTTLIAIVLLAAVIAAGLHAVFTVAYVRASFRTNSPEGEAAAQQLKERLNTYLGSSSTFLDLGEVRATAESDPRFKVVSLEKRLPSAIEVVIEERRAAFASPSEEGFDLIDGEGVRIGAAASAEDYVLLAGDFSVTYQGIAAQGAYLPELLGVYAAFSEVLGEPRANFVSVSLEASGVASSTRFDRFRFASREGVEIVIWDPASAPAELGKVAAEAYLSLGDAQRVRGNILVQRTASGGVSAEYVSSL